MAPRLDKSPPLPKQLTLDSYEVAKRQTKLQSNTTALWNRSHNRPNVAGYG